jgi:glutamate-1-semialdehyde aminotransferase
MNINKKKTNINNLILKSKRLIPGGGTMLFSKIPENFLKKGWPAYYSRTNKINLWDLNNKKYLDFYFGVGQNNLGYNNKNIDTAIKECLRKGNMSTLSCPEEIILAEEMLKLNNWADMVRFARTGGEANAIAVRIARAKSKKDIIAVCGYHGWHDWYLSANINNKKNLNNHLMTGLNANGVPKALNKTITTFKYNDIESFYNAIKDKNVGVVKMEVMRNFLPENYFLHEIREICTKKKIILIFDECTTGFRETFGGLYSKFNVIPDIVVYGKAIGNGYAITSVVGKGEIMTEANNTFVSSTFWTERIGYVAGIRTLEEMKRIKSWKIIKENGLKIKKLWMSLLKNNKIKGQINGMDSIPSLSFDGKNNIKYKSFITQEMLKKNILASNMVFTSILHKDNYLKIYKEAIIPVFEKIKNFEYNNENIDDYLKGNESNSGFKRMN